MLPTTLSGIVLFLVFLMPGLAYSFSRERHRPTKKLSVFRESAATVFVSAAWLLFLLAIAFGLGYVWSDVHKNLLSLLSDPIAFVQVQKLFAVGLLVGYLLVTTILSFLAGTARFRRISRKLSRNDAADPASSAWWILFDQQPDTDKILSITLEDGTWLSGTLFSWSRDSDDTPDRELTIREPLRVRGATSDEVTKPDDQAAITVSARRILYMGVQYREKAPTKVAKVSKEVAEDGSST